MKRWLFFLTNNSYISKKPQIMKKITLLFLFVIFSSLGNAQNSENPWAVNLGLDIASTIKNDKQKDIQSLMAPTLGLTRHVYKGFSLGIQYTPNFIIRKSDKLYFTALDWFLKYNLNNKKLTPYLFTGYGLSALKDLDNNLDGAFPSTESFRTVFGGVGVHYFITDQWALNYSSSYRGKAEKDAYNHLLHIIGLSYHFGASDMDGDGITDNNDDCPTLPGLKEFKGCPDTDGDGIPEPNDDCPMEAGLEIYNGCPDSDGDGTPDIKDTCPNEPGLIELMGCPDRDSDGVIDSQDECPDQFGPEANNGCPYKDTDGDTVLDKDDLCPEEKGTPSNSGCPKEEEPDDLKAFLDSERSTLLFVLGEHYLTTSSLDKLNELNSLLKKYPNTTIRIEGHASSDGTELFNMKLSEKRALKVKEKLIQLGIPENSIQTTWYGENKPLHSNKTPKGRILNRRVKIK